MNIKNYLGLQYDIRNENGVNCWGLYALVLINEVGAYRIAHKANNAAEASAIFASQLASGEHGLTKSDSPMDFDLVLMRKSKEFHCGVLYQGGVLHARGSGRKGSVCYDELMDIKQQWSVEFYCDNSHHKA